MVGGKNFTANFDGGYSPTDGTNTQQGGAAVSAAPTKLLLTPQNARNTRNLLLRETPTDGTDWHRCLGAQGLNNGLNRLNGFLLLGIFNNGLNRLNGFYSSGGILPPPRPSYIRAIRAIRGRNILDVRGRPQNTLNTRKTIAERWTNTNYANNTNFVCLPTSVPSVGGFSLQEVL